MYCTIGGYHSEGQLQGLRTCDLCGKAICVEHRGLHWERHHKANVIDYRYGIPPSPRD
jgi:uncharacterized UBP type Zn finger protein